MNTDRRHELLLHSRDLLRTRGFNAFSHRDLAHLVGVKSSSVHYHFPTKEAVGVAVMADYRTEVTAFLASVEHLPASQRLDRFIDLFAQAADSGEQWCLAGMLASDFMTLGEELQSEVRRFFIDIEAWLAAQARLLRPTMKRPEAQRLGQTAMALLEGSLLLARSQGEPQRVAHAGQAIKLLLGAA